MHVFLRFLRPQFSLRAILLLMMLIGVGLAVWRWPWQEDVPASYLPRLDAPPEFAMMHAPIMRTRMQFRRGWWGERLKTGPAESFDEKGRLVARQTYYDDFLNGPETWFDVAGRPIAEQYRRNDKRSGPFRYGDGFRWKMSGQYDNEWRIGECRDDEEWQSGLTIERISRWSNRRLHGPCAWQVAGTGEVLQRGVFENGAVVEWNGQPVQNLLKQWAAADKLSDRELSHLLRTEKLGPGYSIHAQRLYLDRAPNDTISIPLELDPTLPNIYSPSNLFLPGGEPAGRATDELLAAVVPWGLTIDERYGQLWIAPAEDLGMWRDPTGVDRIVPLRNSKLADAWNSPHAYREAERRRDGLDSLEEIVRSWPTGTEVVLDIATHFPQLHKQWNESRQKQDPPNVTDPTLRNWLGARLYRAGLQCELEGNRLVILPHWSQRPLLLPRKEASSAPQ